MFFFLLKEFSKGLGYGTIAALPVATFLYVVIFVCHGYWEDAVLMFVMFFAFSMLALFTFAGEAFDARKFDNSNERTGLVSGSD